METIRKKVLLIEKSASDQAAIEGMLADEAIACDLKVARSFREALEMMRTQEFDLVVADYRSEDEFVPV